MAFPEIIRALNPMSDSMAQRTVLIIDPEAGAVAAIADVLAGDYRTVPVTTADDAFSAIANDRNIAVIVCDHEILQIVGTEFLLRANATSAAASLLIADRADLEPICRAMNDGLIVGFVSKPWERNELRASVRRAMDHRDRLADLRLDQALLRNLMQFSPDGIAITDHQGRFVRANRRALHSFGIPPEADVIGKRIDEVEPSERSREIAELENAIRGSRESSLNRLEAGVDESGNEAWYSVSRSPVLNASRQVVGVVGISRDTTELRLAEARTQALERRLRDAVDCMQDSFTLYDPDERLVLTNARWQHLDRRFQSHMQDGVMFEQTLRTAIDFGIYDAAIERPEEWIRERLAHFRRGDGSPIELCTKDKRWHIVRARRTGDGGTVLIRTDITDLKNKQSELDQKVREQRAIAEFGRFALTAPDRNSLFEHACSFVAEHLGIKMTELLWCRPDGSLQLLAGIGWKPGRRDDATVPSGRESIGGYARESRQPVVVEDWSTFAACERAPYLGEHAVRSSAAVPIIVDDEPVGVIAAHCERTGAIADGDMTFLSSIVHMLASTISRQRAVKSLVCSEQRFRDFANCSADWFWESDMDQRITYFHGANDTIGGPHAEKKVWLGRTRAEFLACVKPDPDPVPVIDGYMKRSEPFANVEYTFRKADGTFGWVSLSGVPIPGEDGSTVAYRGIGTDITARKSAERALKRSVERFELAARASSAGLWDWDAATGSVYYSPRFCALLGLAAEQSEPTLNLVRALCHPDDLERARESLEGHLQRDEPLDLECRLRHADGNYRWFHVVGEAEFDGLRRPKRICGSIQDVSDKRRTEEQLRHAQKMDAIGNLTGGVAHDFNNMLTVILGNLDILADLVADDPEKLELVTAALRAGERSADLTERLLIFSRRQVLEPCRIDVNELISKLVKLLDRTIGPDVRIRLDLAGETRPVHIDPSQLESALANLAVNARDAMPDGGALTIATRNVDVDEAYALAHTEMLPGNYVVIEMTDTGIGIPADHQARIFEPFFTTKEVGEGAGLGLSVIFGFLKQSGGHIAVDSEPGLGTCFRLYLPEDITAPSHEIVATGPVREATKAGETILVVDDESAIRVLTVNQLRSLGYRTLEADDGASALAILGRGERIDLVFSDVAMPGKIQGPELVKRALDMRPGIKVLLMSGFRAGFFEELADAGLAIPTLAKPFRRDALAEAVRKAIDR